MLFEPIFLTLYTLKPPCVDDCPVFRVSEWPYHTGHWHESPIIIDLYVEWQSCIMAWRVSDKTRGFAYLSGRTCTQNKRQRCVAAAHVLTIYFMSSTKSLELRYTDISSLLSSVIIWEMNRNGRSCDPQQGWGRGRHVDNFVRKGGSFSNKRHWGNCFKFNRNIPLSISWLRQKFTYTDLTDWEYWLDWLYKIDGWHLFKGII